MPDPIAKRLAALPKLSNAALSNLWGQLFRSPPPRLRRELMLCILAYRMQEQGFGSLNAESRSRLRQLARTFANDAETAIPSVPGIKPGTRLLRQWQDKVHVVHVAEKSYEYKGSRYQSLSEIARLITGTRWSGPAFFGIGKYRKEAA